MNKIFAGRLLKNASLIAFLLSSFLCCASSNLLANNVDNKVVNGESSAKKVKLIIRATLVKNGETIKSGLKWRVYKLLKKGEDGSVAIKTNDAIQPNGEKTSKSLRNSGKQLVEVVSSNNAVASFDLALGDYYVECSFGRVSAVKTIRLNKLEDVKTSINLDAGGIEVNAKIKDGSLDPNQLHISLFSDESEDQEHSLLLKNIKLGDVVPLKSGFYHLLSDYGSVNSFKRANLRVEAGKISQVSIIHESAQVNFRLLRDSDGEAIADTKWSIRDASGDVIFNSAGAYASAILTEGHYTAMAENKQNFYQKSFDVESGKDLNVDVLTADKAKIEENTGDDWATD